MQLLYDDDACLKDCFIQGKYDVLCATGTSNTF